MSEDTFHNLAVEEESHDSRLDKFLASALRQFSRSQIQRWIVSGLVQIDGTPVTDAKRKVKCGNQVVVKAAPRELELPTAEALEFEIMYEDQWLLVVNKPQGMVVHPGAGQYHGTLVNGLLYHLGRLPKALDDDFSRPGIVHRLDKDTSGVLVTAKTEAALRSLSEQFKEKSTYREYVALVQGDWKQVWVSGAAKDSLDSISPNSISPNSIEVCGFIGRDPVVRNKMCFSEEASKLDASDNSSRVPLNPKWSRSELFFERQLTEDIALIRVKLDTGRTHQIRLHCAHLGVPVLGDSMYGRRNCLVSRQMLHAYLLEFYHPVTKKRLKFLSKIPNDFRGVIQDLRDH